MAKKIMFNQFKQLIDDQKATFYILADYLELDPASSIPKLRLKPNVLTDEVPEGYDVDTEVYKKIREAERREDDERNEYSALVDSPHVVAEGDSWFRLPPIIRPKAIATHLRNNPRYNVHNIAYWGHTLSRMLREKEYMEHLSSHNAEFFPFSAGGNDLQEGITKYIKDFEESRPLDDYLTDEGKTALNEIGGGYRTLLDEVTKGFPKVKIICYGYDYPRPHDEGEYIGKYMREKGIPEPLMKPILTPIINKLNEVIKKAAGLYPRAFYINCLNITDQYTWYDDMHPESDGFRVLAAQFEGHM